jgi:hypothetical protein
LLSTIPPKADFARSLRDVSFVPETDIDPNFDPERRSFIPSAAGSPGADQLAAIGPSTVSMAFRSGLAVALGDN